MGTGNLASAGFQTSSDVSAPNANLRDVSESQPTLMARKGNPGFGWVVDVLWPDGETEVIKGFAAEHETVEWINQHSKGLQGKSER